MSGIRKDELGFMRSSGYGRIDLAQVRKELGATEDEAIYHTSNKGGVRSSRVATGKSVEFKPGDTLNAGPQIVKAAGLFDLLRSTVGDGGSDRRRRGNPPVKDVPSRTFRTQNSDVPNALKPEVEALKRAGFGAVPQPELSEWGWSVRLKGMPLPGGCRTDALILLPRNYPNASPIGFYLKKGAAIGGLDTGHLYDGAYHGAQDLTKHGWQWFCGIAEGWRPGRHTLVTYLSLVQSMLAERSL
jgi:hypothetical protein